MDIFMSQSKVEFRVLSHPEHAIQRSVVCVLRLQRDTDQHHADQNEA